jgi:putative nucleotidyltransferase with HDIG domain
MERQAHASSIFSQSLDRAVFVVYFLGAVVPLMALGYFVQGYVLPGLDERFESVAVIGSVVGIAMLSLAAFFTLRRLARTTLARMDADRRRLATLLEVSRTLSLAPHAAEVLDTVARCALDLLGARGAVVLSRAKPEEAFSVRSAAGMDARRHWDELEGELQEAVELATREGRPVVAGAGGAVDPHGYSAAVVPVEARSRGAGALVALRPGGDLGFGPRELDALAALAGTASVALHNADLHETQRNFFTHVTDVLVTALDAHLDQQGGHSHRVAQYANRIGRLLGMDDHQLERLHFASLLHDIGMLKLDRAHHRSRTAAEKHPQLGFRMLHRIRLWEDIAPFVQHHHEWYDGSGYPGGLASDAIPLESRIIMVADAFDAMTSDTSYKAARTPEEACRELREGAGTQFDPKIVSAMLELLEQGAIEPPPRG